MKNWGFKKPGKYGLQLWTCGRLLKTPSAKMHRRLPSDLKDRSEESMNLFYEELGLQKAREIRLAVMDMWKAFENSIRKHAPQAAIRSQRPFGRKHESLL